ncbi:hypothetical protein ACU90_01640 [Escherichia coli]|nr:hypothetical protein ACU90_01640 [Escherichia coli]
MRISKELRQQVNEAATSDGLTLGNWFKELARAELKRRGIEPKG